MTVSGSSNFTATRDQIILRALRQAGAFAAGETPDAQTVSDASFALNAMVKEWNALGIHLWTESEATLFLQPNQVSYVLGPNSMDNATASWSQTTLSAAAASGANSISVASVSGIASTYKIGIVLNSGTLFWTTVSGAPSGLVVTLAAALSGPAAQNNAVYCYQTAIGRPLRIAGARRFNIPSALDTQMIPLSRLDYRNMPNKSDTGTPTQYFFDPQTQGSNPTWTLDNAYLYLWPAPTSVQDAIKFTWYRSIVNFDTQANTPDFPQEWINCLTWNLAVQMAPEYDVPPPRYEMLKEQAAISLDRVMGWDREPESIYFGVDFDQTTTGSG